MNDEVAKSCKGLLPLRFSRLPLSEYFDIDNDRLSIEGEVTYVLICTETEIKACLIELECL